MPVIVLDELGEDALQMCLIQDQEPVEAFPRTVRTNRSATAFACGAEMASGQSRSSRWQTPRRRLRELLIPIANQEAERLGALGQRPHHLSGLLRDPQPSRMGRAAGDVHVTAASSMKKITYSVGARPSPR